MRTRRNGVFAASFTLTIVGVALALFGTIQVVSPFPFTGGTSTYVSKNTTVTVVTTCLCPASGECPCASGRITTPSYILNALGVSVAIGGTLVLIFFSRPTSVRKNMQCS